MRDLERCVTWPLAAGDGTEYRSTASCQLIQANLPGVPLSNCVGRQQTRRTARLGQTEGTQEEVGNVVGAAARPARQIFDQVVPIGCAENACDPLPADKWGVANN